jgi:hypothetical protein
LELTSYGLTALTAMMVVAFCFAYGDELPRTREEFSCDLISAAHLNDSMMIESGARSRRYQGDVRKQQGTVPAYLLQKTSRVETGHGAIYIGSVRSDRGTLEAFHG